MTGGTVTPVPQGDYVPARRHGGLIFTAGMTPRRDGVLIQRGPVGKDDPPEAWHDAVTLACGNALIAARAMLAEGEEIAAVLNVTVYVAAEHGFTSHSRLADSASRFLAAELGAAGRSARTAVGVATLPGDAPVEIQLVVAV